MKKLEKQKGLMLDLGCGNNKTHGFVGLDKRKLDGVDIVHDLEIFPYPLESESCLSIVASHVIEHIRPTPLDTRLVGLVQLLLDKKIISLDEIGRYIGEVTDQPVFMRFMAEIWRLLKPDGRVAFGLPYGRSDGMLQDPTHINFFNEATFQYFDPEYPLYYIYRPLPFKIIENAWVFGGNMQVILEKRIKFLDQQHNRKVEASFDKYNQT